MASGKYAALGQRDRDDPPIIVEPFVPPPQSLRRGPSGPRPLPAALSPPSRQSSISEGTFRQGLVESPRSAGAASLRSKLSHESLLSAHSSPKSPHVVSFQPLLAPPKHRPPGLDPNRLGYYEHTPKLTTSSTPGTSEDVSNF